MANSALFVAARHHPVYSETAVDACPIAGKRQKRVKLGMNRAVVNQAERRHGNCYFPAEGVPSMAYLASRLFWDKKVKIALLALATFVAMC